ncbi:MAG: hypothetical protein GEV10_15385 [Streptosporangiales bacterium]|nr:hypothetical protein [Streptosporangiales bacterium]
MGRHLTPRARLVGTIALALAVPAATFTVVTAPGDTTAAAGHHHANAVTTQQSAVTGTRAQASCTPRDRRQTLARDQRRLLARLGTLVVLRDEADVDRLTALGFDSFPHWQTSLTGVGWTAADMDAMMAPTPGKPSMLSYRPSGTSNGPRDGYDFPYVLAGWSYQAPYDVAKYPAQLLPCVSRAEWFAHERGIHLWDDGGFEPVPPVEEQYGTAPGADPPQAPPPSYGHPRAWDLHIWLNGTPVPTTSVRNPGRPIPGLDVPEGTFFFPPMP